MKNLSKYAWISLIIFLLLSACGVPDAAGPDQPVSSDDTPSPAETPAEGELVYSESAIVEEMDILFLESFPLQVMVNLKGQLPNGCVTVEEAKSERVDETTFVITLTTVQPKDAMCTQVLTPFEENVSLDVYGLPAGEYSVQAGDITKTFTFEQDNIIEE